MTTPLPSTPVDAPSPPAVVAPSPPPRPKQIKTPKQLAQLAAAREKRKEYAKNRGQTAGGGTVARNQDSANDLVKRIEERDHEAHASRGSKRKREGKISKHRSRSSVSLPSSLLVGALAVGGIGYVAYTQKKNFGLSTAPGGSGSTANQTPSPMTNPTQSQAVAKGSTLIFGP